MTTSREIRNRCSSKDFLYFFLSFLLLLPTFPFPPFDSTLSLLYRGFRWLVNWGGSDGGRGDFTGVPNRNLWPSWHNWAHVFMARTLPPTHESFLCLLVTLFFSLTSHTHSTRYKKMTSQCLERSRYIYCWLP